MKLIAPSVGVNSPLLAARKFVALVLARLNARAAWIALKFVPNIMSYAKALTIKPASRLIKALLTNVTD